MSSTSRGRQSAWREIEFKRKNGSGLRPTNSIWSPNRKFWQNTKTSLEPWSENVLFVFSIIFFIFSRVPEPWQLPINSKGDSKASLFIDRYNLILQRLKRSPLFSGSKEGFQLTTTDSLIGSHGKKFLFGMITQFEEGKYHLEDPKGTVALDLSKSQYSSGLFCEVCSVHQMTNCAGMFCYCVRWIQTSF